MRRTHLAGLAALAAVALACGSGGKGDDKGSSVAPKPGTTQKVGASPKPSPKPAGLKDAVRDGEFEFTVTKVDCSLSKIGNEYVNTTAQGKFCLVHLTVKNISRSAEMFDPSAQRAFDAERTAYEPDTSAALYVNEDAGAFFTAINPGNQAKGVVPFDVPKNVELTRLELHDSALSGGVEVFLR